MQSSPYHTPSRRLFPLLNSVEEEFSNPNDDGYHGEEELYGEYAGRETPSKSRQEVQLLNALKEWINLMIGSEVVEIKTQNPLQSFLNCFKDGVVLCRIIEKIKLKHITFNKHTGGKEVVERENFQTFLKVSKDCLQIITLEGIGMLSSYSRINNTENRTYYLGQPRLSL